VKALAAATMARATDTSTDRCILWFPDNNFLLVYNEKKKGKTKRKEKGREKGNRRTLHPHGSMNGVQVLENFLVENFWGLGSLHPRRILC